MGYGNLKSIFSTTSCLNMGYPAPNYWEGSRYKYSFGFQLPSMSRSQNQNDIYKNGGWDLMWYTGIPGLAWARRATIQCRMLPNQSKIKKLNCNIWTTTPYWRVISQGIGPFEGHFKPYALKWKIGTFQTICF